jgi:hypothetical protein
MVTGSTLFYCIDDGLMFYRWRLHRRIFHQSFRQAAISAYHPVQLRSAHKMLLSFLKDSNDYPNHFEMCVGCDSLYWSRADADRHQVYFLSHTVCGI